MMYSKSSLCTPTTGTAQGYHTLTFGLYADQLVRRVDPKHRSLSQFFQEEIAQPHGNALLKHTYRDYVHY